MLKYKINVLEELKKKGVTQYTILKEGIMGQSTVTKIRNGKVVTNDKVLNTLCSILDLQPGDIVEYIRDE